MSKDDQAESSVTSLGRRDLMKIGAGVVMTTLTSGAVAAQENGDGRTVQPGAYKHVTGPGFKYTANRLGGNGPMDETTRKVVSFVRSFDESKLTAPVMAGLNKIMVDTLTAWIAGFHSEP